MKLISLVFMYVGIMNKTSRKLTKNVYFLSQVQEIGPLELTTLSFNYPSSQQYDPLLQVMIISIGATFIDIARRKPLLLVV